MVLSRATFSVIVLFIGVSLVPKILSAAPVCGAFETSDPAVPLCPASGTMIPETYPAAAVMLSDDTGLTTDGAGEKKLGFERSRIAGNVAMSILRAAGKNPPQLLLSMSDETIDAIRARIRLEAPDANTRDRWLNALTRVRDSVKSRFNWQQDFAQPYFNPQTGRPVLRPISDYRNTGFVGSDGFANVIASAEAACGIEAGAPIKPTGQFVGGHGGGNLESLPGGTCLIGSDSFRGDQWTEYSQNVCTDGGRPLEIDTSWLTVGHTDEIFSVVPSTSNSCGFAIMAASPRAGLDALAQNPSEKAFDWADGLSDEVIHERIQAHDPWSDICQAWSEAPSGLNSTPGRKSVPRSNRTNSRLLLVLPSIAKASDEDALDENQTSDSTTVQTKDMPICASMTNSDLLAAMTVPNRRGVGNLKEYNNVIQATMDQNKEKLRSRLKETHPECDIPIIDVPSLFTGDLGQDKNGQRFAKKGTALGLQSNPTNGININGTMIFPDPGNASLRRNLEARLKTHGVKSDFIDMTYAHLAQGNLHCSTNVIRYCRPRAR